MLESVHCPKCAAHYALRPPRVLQRHRRAKCFTCDYTFPIAEEVQRLFAMQELGSSTVGLDTSGLSVHTVSTTGIAPEDIFAAQMHPAQTDEARATAEGPLHLLEATATHSGGPLTDLPSLTFQDLEEADSAMEKTLVLQPGEHPEHRIPADFGSLTTHGADQLEALGLAPPQDLPPASSADDGAPHDATTGYSSARDAIEKLMAGTPSVQRIKPMSMGRGGSPMDVEGTLDALEATLGGSPTSSLGMPGNLLHAHPEPPAAEDNSTVVLSTKELDFAMSAQTAEPEPSASTRLMNVADMPSEDVSHMERTLRMPLPTLTPPPAGAMTSPILRPMSPPPPEFEPVKDPNLLKVQLESETLSNVAMDQLMQLVEQGRVKEYHLVARQFSENWLEANKVPALRPVFERMRRSTQIGPVPTMPGEATAPVKKSLFGGLFGGKN